MVVSLSVELGFQIQIVSGIPDSLSCILDSKAQDSRFQKWPVCRPASSDVWKAPLGRFYLPVYNSYFTCCFCFRLWLTLLTDAIPLLEHEEVGDFGCVCFFFLQLSFSDFHQQWTTCCNEQQNISCSTFFCLWFVGDVSRYSGHVVGQG